MRNNSGRERKDENLLSFLMSEKYNDREINEWYNKRNQGDKLEVMEVNYEHTRIGNRALDFKKIYRE